MTRIPRNVGLQFARVLLDFGATAADIDDLALVGMAADMGILEPHETRSIDFILDPVRREGFILAVNVDVWLRLRGEAVQP